MSEDNNGAVCRVCHCEEEPSRPLYYPCKCRGSIKYVHQECLLKWIEVSGKDDALCELCGSKYSFRRVYTTGLRPPAIGLIDIIEEVFNGVVERAHGLYSWLETLVVLIATVAGTYFSYVFVINVLIWEKSPKDYLARLAEAPLDSHIPQLLLTLFVGIVAVSIALLFPTIWEFVSEIYYSYEKELLVFENMSELCSTLTLLCENVDSVFSCTRFRSTNFFSKTGDLDRITDIQMESFKEDGVICSIMETKKFLQDLQTMEPLDYRYKVELWIKMIEIQKMQIMKLSTSVTAEWQNEQQELFNRCRFVIDLANHQLKTLHSIAHKLDDCSNTIT